MIVVELKGLEVHGRHGAYEEEKVTGQPFWFDVELAVGDRGADDDLEGAVDYTEVAAAIREVSERQRFDLLEALAVAVADELRQRFRVGRVVVKVRKRPAGLPVEWAAATVTRP
jgi:7,8-dihydroneopterin aldolase/epimerase/oxygenase